MVLLTLILIIVVIYFLNEHSKKREAQKLQLQIQAESQALIDKYKNSTVEEIVCSEELIDFLKQNLLLQFFNYSYEESYELLKAARKAEGNAKLRSVKRDIEKKIQERYETVISDDNRSPIPDDVKDSVWRRDGGKCVKCGSQEKIEYDHIIPVSKGGSNTARNIQILCEKCNREKSDKIG